MKKMLTALSLSAALVAAGCAYAYPVVDIGNRHGNLRHAQECIVEAWNAIGQAQADNDGHLGGHAARAKELLDEANQELRMAADVANGQR